MTQVTNLACAQVSTRLILFAAAQRGVAPVVHRHIGIRHSPAVPANNCHNIHRNLRGVVCCLGASATMADSTHTNKLSNEWTALHVPAEVYCDDLGHFEGVVHCIVSPSSTDR